MRTTDERDSEQEAKRLYELYIKPVEPYHTGEFVAVSPQGQTIFGPTVLDVLQKAATSFGPDNFVFKVGERVVGKWR